jgi:hypothetical protein
MKKLAQPAAMLAVGFLVLAVWRSPATAAADVSHVLGNVGTFLQEVLTKVAEFLGSFGKS